MKFNEYSIGQLFETESLKLTKEDIMRFAGEFDPLYMHVNEEKAAEGRFNGIIASGIHTMSVSYKLWIALDIFAEDVIAGLGMNNIAFIKPVYPGDELRTVVEVIDKKEKNKEAGAITLLLSTYNHKDEKVFAGELSVLVKQ
ncbi:MaoC/PaaZ C-terminal domain-containing protein [Alkalicoccus halolimnae]|uniref:MaoC/PaaZ C-terminal domain-containing protein n=1 Tax=Alkalicoccus halolimnae TaxID=1667239 RepID=A0A5C7FDE4_9BACI|nr:MaoC/PaaZ C-terminal domain-containing protein [Alkalicoccus halolimnae]TXF85317.1 hypothetical protein FTX54_09020 [Alkalicoccus halolimnae]